jgi:hypothetical protein
MSRIGFLVIGAEKTGSTSLFKYMQRHPQIHMPAEKELHFFNADRVYRRGWRWYADTVVRGAPAGAVCGEAGQYMIGVTDRDADDYKSTEEIVPQRIQQFLPTVKLICVLRDPAARAYSEYQMGILDQVESRPFDEAIDQLLRPEALKDARAAHTRTNGYVVSGEYYRILSGFLRFFERRQLLAIFSSDLADRPAATLANVFEFIGVASDFVPDNIGTRYRTAATRQRLPGVNLFIWGQALSRVSSARAAWHLLPARAQTDITRVYNVAGNRIALWNARRGATASNDIPRSAYQKLIAHFRPDSEALGALLNREIPWLAKWESA